MMQNNPYRGAFLLIVAAAVLLAIAAATGRGDITTATLILAGAGCFVTGVFLLALHKGEPLDPGIAALLPAQGTITIATLCADLGVQGDAWFIPDEGTVIEVIPVGTAVPAAFKDDYSFITSDACAVRITPTSAPLLAHLQEKHALEIPDEDDALLACIIEVCDDLLEVAEKTEAKREGANIVVTLHGYRLMDGCRAVRAASPKCCTMVGCPVCSLIAAIAALGTGGAVKFEHIGVDEKKGVLRIILTRPEPRGAGHGNSR
ncbi:MAG: hypothetical protein GX837_11090 [Methanomicrobiales archaeon]|nr:hypothetical protein [Methanomicrobiales archaeon]